MPDLNTAETKLLESLLETFQRLPETQAKVCRILQPDSPVHRCQVLIDLRINGKSTKLKANIRKTVYPRDAKQVAWQFQEMIAETQQSIPFLVAQSISPGAKDLLKEKQIGYYDSGGSLFVVADKIFVYVDKPPPKSISKSIRSLFSGRRAQVLQVVLMRQMEWYRVNDLAKKSKVSPATVSQVLTELEKFDWVVSRGQGPTKERQLREPGTLLDTWVNQLGLTKPLTQQRYFVPSIHSEELIKRFAEECIEKNVEYAITHEAAGQLYAPYLSNISQVRCRMLTGSEADEVLAALDARLVDQGSNLTVIEVKSPGELLLRQSVNRIYLANPVQVYLDLIQSEGRSREMAKHLRNEILGF